MIEVYWQGQLIGAVYGADGPGIRFISKYPHEAIAINGVIEIRICSPKAPSDSPAAPSKPTS
jgi:hypothetical protein